MPNFRKDNPKNTCDKKYKNYRDYKPYLITDFHGRCGYCNDHDSWTGGKRSMQIDHFAPKKKFPTQENVYANLVYSCFYCNNHKSNDWVTDTYDIAICSNNLTGYIHPREITYAQIFNRSDNGRIIPNTDVAKYIYKQLCLGLKRHQLIFILEELEDLWKQLTTLSIGDDLSPDKKDILIGQKLKIADKFLEYLTEYKGILNT